jgi:hypothetical protein
MQHSLCMMNVNLAAVKCNEAACRVVVTCVFSESKSPLWRQQQHGRMSRAEGRRGSVVIPAPQIFESQTSVVSQELTHKTRLGTIWRSCIIVVTPSSTEVRFDSPHHHSQTGRLTQPVKSRVRDAKHSRLFIAKVCMCVPVRVQNTRKRRI